MELVEELNKRSTAREVGAVLEGKAPISERVIFLVVLDSENTRLYHMGGEHPYNCGSGLSTAKLYKNYGTALRISETLNYKCRDMSISDDYKVFYLRISHGNLAEVAIKKV
jgi:hypothetical protein